MTAPLHSDALVFFGATGDLVYKQIFPGAGRAGELESPHGRARHGPRTSCARHGVAKQWNRHLQSSCSSPTSTAPL
jgi:glucose-6-phosphate 1-dehydrogenase